MLQHSFVGVVDSVDVDHDQVNVKFSNKVGHYWLSANHDELLDTLRLAHRSGAAVEVTFDTVSSEIRDIICRSHGDLRQD